MQPPSMPMPLKKPLIAGEEGEGALISERLEDAGIDPACCRHIAVRLGHHAIAALLQLRQPPGPQKRAAPFSSTTAVVPSGPT